MANYFLDITKDHCPMTFVKAKLKVESMQSGDILEICLKDGEPIQNVPRSLEENNCTIISTEKEEDYYILTVKKN